MRRRFLSVIPLLVLAVPWTFAQSPAAADTTYLSTTYVFGGLGAFIPLRDSYRLNYSNSLAGLPLELQLGVMMPISQSGFAPLTVRYIRREANFISSTSIGVISFEPGVRFFLEHARENDLRIFGAIEGLVAEATVQGTYDATSDGSSPVPAVAQKTYWNFGGAVDLGLSYPLAERSALDVALHVASYFGSPIASGGLGDIGGISLTAAYRIGF